MTGGLPQPTLRGIGQDVVGPGTDPGFILHINGTYVNQLAVALLGFHDMERVEVAPGPTGIDYGRATTGGSMNFIWHRPKIDEWSVTGDAQVASFDAVRMRTSINFPIVEGVLAGRLALSRVWGPDSYDVKGRRGNARGQTLATNALGPGEALRGSLRYTPNEDFTADLMVQWTRDTSQGGKARILDPFPAYPAGQSPLFGGSPNYTFATPNPSDPTEIYLNQRNEQRYETLWAQLILEYEIGSFILKSTSSYQYWDYHLDFDWDGSDVNAERLLLEGKDIGWSSELVLQSDFDGPVQFLVGGNYQVNESPDTELPVWDYQQNRAAANFQIFDVTTLLPANYCVDASGNQAPCLFNEIDPNRAAFHLRGNTETEMVGAFGKIDWEVTETVKVTLGGRYSYTHREFNDTSTFDVYTEAYDQLSTVCEPLAAAGVIAPQPDKFSCFDTALSGVTFFANLLAGIPIAFPTPSNTAYVIPLQGAADITTLNQTAFTRKKSWNSLDWLARVEYRPNDDMLFYGYIATGERHGGFNWLEIDGSDFDPEEILAYEVGGKFDFPDIGLRLNGTVYYYDYSDKFVTQTLANVTTTQNAGDATIFGVEVQFWWVPTENLRFNGNIGYIDAEFKDRLPEPGQQPLARQPHRLLPGQPGRRPARQRTRLHGCPDPEHQGQCPPEGPGVDGFGRRRVRLRVRCGHADAAHPVRLARQLPVPSVRGTRWTSRRATARPTSGCAGPPTTTSGTSRGSSRTSRTTTTCAPTPRLPEPTGSTGWRSRAPSASRWAGGSPAPTCSGSTSIRRPRARMASAVALVAAALVAFAAEAGPDEPAPARPLCAWFGDVRDGTLWFGLSAFWPELRASGGDPLADLRAGRLRALGAHDLASDGRQVHTLAEDVPTGVWDVLAHPNGRIYYTTFFGAAGVFDPADGRVRELPEAGDALNELALGPGGRILATRYRDPASVVVLDEAGRVLAELPLGAVDGYRVAAKSLAWDPVRAEIWVNTDLLPLAGGAPSAHDTRILAPDGRERLRWRTPEVQFMSFGPDGTGYFAEVEGERLRLRVRPPEAAGLPLLTGRWIALDDAFPGELDFVQEVRVDDRGRVAVTRWSGRIHLLEPGGKVRDVWLPHEPGDLFYTGVHTGERVCATVCRASDAPLDERPMVVCAPLPE